MSDKMTIADADDMRGVADRCERVARTARRIAPAHGAPLSAMLLELAERAESVAFTATAVARFLDPEGETEMASDSGPSGGCTT